jgi:hypothetical protein
MASPHGLSLYEEAGRAFPSLVEIAVRRDALSRNPGHEMTIESLKAMKASFFTGDAG